MTNYLLKIKGIKRVNMISAGIDLGGENIHIVITQNGKIIAKGLKPTAMQKAKAAKELYDEILSKAGLKRSDVDSVVATGSFGKHVSFANRVIPSAVADGRGVNHLIPSARTVIDVGAEEGRAVKVSSEGEVLDFVINEKCAAGTGTFIEAMARALEITVEEMAKISMTSNRLITINAQCAVFGESEVISLIHQRIAKQDIARAVHDAIAVRIASLVRIVGFEKDVVMIGGLAKNVGFVDSLKKKTEVDIVVPDEPDFVGALGAAEAAE
jgi:benzoyl-CoA reductase subunit D